MIYLAAPLFTPNERRFNEELANLLGDLDLVFLPQRDGLLLTELVKSGMPVTDAEHDVFRRDVAAINQCRLLIAVLDGAVVDEGVAFEIGFAFARGVPCIGLQTDCRRQLPTGNNPMVSQALLELFHDARQMHAWCKEHINYLTVGSEQHEIGIPLNYPFGRVF